MNIQEREQLTDFLEQLGSARAGNKDSEAEALIRAACARQPDAAYLLVQRLLVQEQALKNAQEEISRLRSQPAAGSGSFFNDSAWGHSAAVSRPAPPPLMPAAPASAGSGWLGNIAATAAGVVAGSFIAQGIGNLFGDHHNSNSLLDASAATTTSPVEHLASNDVSGRSDNSLDSLDDGLDGGLGGDSTWL